MISLLGVPVNTKHWPNAGFMLAWRRRHRLNIKPTLGQFLMISEVVCGGRGGGGGRGASWIIVDIWASSPVDNRGFHAHKCFIVYRLSSLAQIPLSLGRSHFKPHHRIYAPYFAFWIKWIDTKWWFVEKVANCNSGIDIFSLNIVVIEVNIHISLRKKRGLTTRSLYCKNTIFGHLKFWIEVTKNVFVNCHMYKTYIKLIRRNIIATHPIKRQPTSAL